MNFLSRLETRFQELLFLILIVGVPLLSAGLVLAIQLPADTQALWMGKWGSLFFNSWVKYTGYASFLLPVFFGEYIVAAIKRFEEPLQVLRAGSFHNLRLASYSFFLLWLSFFLGVLGLQKNSEELAAKTEELGGTIGFHGGKIGSNIGSALVEYFGIYGSISILAAFFVGSAIIMGWLDLIALAMAGIRVAHNLTIGNIKRLSGEAAKQADNPLAHPDREELGEFEKREATGSFVIHGNKVVNSEECYQDETEEENEEAQKKAAPKKPKLKSVPRSKIEAESNEATSEATIDDKDKPKEITIAPFKGRYSYPSKSLVAKQGRLKTPTAKELKARSKIIEERLASFGVKGEIVKVHPGIRLTMFEFNVQMGIKLSRISALTDDLALLLGAPSIRILTPIPGKTTVGIEVPNEDSSLLNFSSALDELGKAKSQMNLPVVIGQDVSGKMQISDLSAMPHLLVSGTTGSGKSVFVNTLITSLLYSCSPKELRMIMVDPKMIELTPYNKAPHLAEPVISDAADAKDTLVWAEKEMDKRYEIFSAVGARNIESFNEKIKKVSKKRVEEKLGKKIDWNWGHMPYIVIVVDELADLMITQGKEVEIPITRIAQKARACGIHLVLCTQRPSADIVTGLIKTNFPTRISFKVSSGIDSRTILDASGAEKLLGNGDMLFLPNGKSIVRLQGPFLSERDVNAVVGSIQK